MFLRRLSVRYFVAYHNEQKTKILCTNLPYPRVRTKKKVFGLEGSVVWMIAGAGKSPKSYYLVSTFIIDKFEPNKYPGDDLPNEVSGTGRLFGLSILLDQTSILEKLKRQTANFASGFFEINNSAIISEFESLLQNK
jgi:hypothetical protein